MPIEETDRPVWRSAITLFVLYLLVGYGSALLGKAQSQSTPIWLGAAVLFAYFMREQGLGSLFAAGWLASGVWGMAAHDLSVVHAIVFGLIETGCAWLGAKAVSYRLKSSPLSLPTVLRLLAGATLTAALGAALAAQFWTSLNPDGTRWLVEWRTWAFSTLLGILLLVPVVLAYQGFRPRRSGGMTRKQFLAGLVAFAIFMVLALSVFSPNVLRFGTSATTLAYLPMPFLLAASMLWGARGGSVAMLIGGLLIVGRSIAGAGPFAVQEAFAGESVIEAQAFVALWAVLLLFGRGLEDERRRALETAKDWQLRYARTLAATGVLSAEFDPFTGQATWNPGAEQIVGGHLDQLQTMDDWLSHVDAASQPMAHAAWQRAKSGHAVQADHYEVLLGGVSYWVEASLAPIFGPDGAVEEVAAVVRIMPAAPAVSTTPVASLSGAGRG